MVALTIILGLITLIGCFSLYDLNFEFKTIIIFALIFGSLTYLSYKQLTPEQIGNIENIERKNKKPDPGPSNIPYIYPY